MTLEPMIFATLFQSLLSSGPTSTDEVNLLARTYSQNCNYYSRSVTDLDVYFTDSVMANFKSVELLYGFGGSTQRIVDGNPIREDFDWKDHSGIPLQLIGRGVWNGKIQKEVHYRSSERFYSTVQFVFKITTNDNHEFFEKGSQTAKGFFTSDLPPVSTCVDTPEALPSFNRLTIKAIDRN